MPDIKFTQCFKIWNRLWHRFVCMAFQPGSVSVRPQYRACRTHTFSSWIIWVLIIRVLTGNSIHFCPQRRWHWHFSDLGGDFSLAANWNVHNDDIMPTLWKKEVRNTAWYSKYSSPFHTFRLSGYSTSSLDTVLIIFLRSYSWLVVNIHTHAYFSFHVLYILSEVFQLVVLYSRFHKETVILL